MNANVTIIFPKKGSFNYKITYLSGKYMKIVNVEEPSDELILLKNSALSERWWGIQNYLDDHLVIIWGLFEGSEEIGDFMLIWTIFDRPKSLRIL